MDNNNEEQPKANKEQRRASWAEDILPSDQGSNEQANNCLTTALETPIPENLASEAAMTAALGVTEDSNTTGPALTEREQMIARALSAAKEAGFISLGLTGLMGFLVFMATFGDSAKVGGGNILIDFLRFTDNDFMLCTMFWALTILVQSSSLSSVMLISMVQEKLFTLRQGIYAIGGANAGTASTNSILTWTEYLTKYFAPTLATNTMHNQINFILNAILFTIQVPSKIAPSGAIGSLVKWMTRGYNPGEDIENPVMAFLKEWSKEIISCDKEALAMRALGGCSDRLVNGGILQALSDEEAAAVGLLIGVAGMGVCLKIISHTLKRYVTDPQAVADYLKSKNSLFTVTLSIGLTICLMSSSSFTVLIHPFIVKGIIDRPTALRAFEGTNVGTTMSTIIFALAMGKIPMQVALSHLAINTLTVTFISMQIPSPTLWLKNITKPKEIAAEEQSDDRDETAIQLQEQPSDDDPIAIQLGEESNDDDETVIQLEEQSGANNKQSPDKLSLFHLIIHIANAFEKCIEGHKHRGTIYIITEITLPFIILAAGGVFQASANAETDCPEEDRKLMEAMNTNPNNLPPFMLGGLQHLSNLTLGLIKTSSDHPQIAVALVATGCVIRDLCEPAKNLKQLLASTNNSLATYFAQARRDDSRGSQTENQEKQANQPRLT